MRPQRGGKSSTSSVARVARRFWNSLGQGCKSSPLDDPLKLGPKVDVVSPIAGNDKFRSRLGLLENFFQIRPQLGENGNHSAFAAGVMFRLRRVYDHPAAFPINIAPA